MYCHKLQKIDYMDNIHPSSGDPLDYKDNVMFKKQRAKREAVLQQAEAVRQETIAGFAKRLGDIELIADVGEQYVELGRFAEDVAGFRPESFKKQVKSRGVKSQVVSYGGIATGAILGVTGYVTDFFLPGTSIILAGFSGATAVAMPSVITGLWIQKNDVSKKLKKQEEGFLADIQSFRTQAQERQVSILKYQSSLLRQSKISESIFNDYAEVREHFAKAAFGEKKDASKPSPKKGLEL